MAKHSTRVRLRLRRKKRIRGKVSGTSARPRMTVHRSARHMSVQVIDDTSGKTLAQASSFEKGNHAKVANKEVCKEVGQRVAERCKAAGIEQVVFDKNGFSFHGRVKSLADSAREHGLSF